MWPFDRKKPPPAAITPEALAKLKGSIPAPPPPGYRPPKNPDIVPILPPPTKDQQYIRDELQAAVMLARSQKPRRQDAPEFAAFKAGLDTFGAHVTAAETALNRLVESGRPAEIEPGAAVIYFLMALYLSRIVAFAKAGDCQTPYAQDEMALLSGALGMLGKDPMTAANAAQVAGVPLDLIESGHLLTALPADRQEAGPQLLVKLWLLCVHSDLELPSKD